MIIAIINKIRNEKKAREGKFTNDDGWREILISIFKSTELFYYAILLLPLFIFL